MTRVLDSQVLISATGNQIFEVLASRDFSIQKAKATDSRVIDFTKTTTTDGLETTLVREFEREIPELARSFIGEKILVKEAFRWNANQDKAIINIEVERAPIEIFGKLHLQEFDHETSLEINLTIKASVPFFNEKIENFAEKIWEAISKEEMRLVSEHFTLHS